MINNKYLPVPMKYCKNISILQDEKTLNFILEAKRIHGDKYDYSKTFFINNRTKVCIICPDHGEFWQAACEHIKKRKRVQRMWIYIYG